MPDSPLKNIERLLAVMQRLREPDLGCPWDLEQDYRSIAPSTIEEAYEVVDAIERGDFDHLREELGDLLFQVVFYAQLAREEKRFDFADIAGAITDKLLRRHPHVFPDGTLGSRVDPDNRPGEKFVTEQWEKIKAEERREKGKTGLLADIPAGLPALLRAYKLQKRVAKVGFDWPDTSGVLEKLAEEFDELQQVVQSEDKASIQDEIGDCLFTLVNLCRHLDIDADTALRGANGKFSQRFALVEQMAERENKNLADCDSEQLERWWCAAKTAVADDNEG